MPNRDKRTEKLCWGFIWDSPCKDYLGNPLRVAWELTGENGHEVRVCDAHLPEALRMLGLPARVDPYVDAREDIDETLDVSDPIRNTSLHRTFPKPQDKYRDTWRDDDLIGMKTLPED